MALRRDGSAAVLTLAGDFDMHTVQSVAQPVEELLQDPPHDLVVDLSGVDFIDSSGIALLVKVYGRVVREGDGTMRVDRTSPVARRLLEVCGLLETFGIDGTRAAAHRLTTAGRRGAVPGLGQPAVSARRRAPSSQPANASFGSVEPGFFPTVMVPLYLPLGWMSPMDFADALAAAPSTVRTDCVPRRSATTVCHAPSSTRPLLVTTTEWEPSERTQRSLPSVAPLPPSSSFQKPPASSERAFWTML